MFITTIHMPLIHFRKLQNYAWINAWINLGDENFLFYFYTEIIYFWTSLHIAAIKMLLKFIMGQWNSLTLDLSRTHLFARLQQIDR